MKITGVKVFSATMVAQREQLGKQVTAWIASRPKGFAMLDLVITQSSDDAFHCIAITVFYFEPGAVPIEHIVKGRASAAAEPRRLKFDGVLCKRCFTSIKLGDMRHSLVESLGLGPMHFACAERFIAERPQ